MKIYLVKSLDEFVGWPDRIQMDIPKKEVGLGEIIFDESICYDFLLVASPEKSKGRLPDSLTMYNYTGKELDNFLESYENEYDKYDKIYVEVPEKDRDLRDAILDK